MNEKQKLFTKHSIGTRIAALFMLLILVITGVMTYVSISVSTSELLDSSTDYTEQLILRVNAELDMYVEYMKDISDFIVDNGAVAAYLQAANEHRLTDAACRGAQQQLAAAQKIRAEITSIALIPQSGGALFGSEGASLNTYSNYHTADWYVDALADPDEVQVSSSRVENLIAGQYNWVVSFSKAVLDAAGQVQGVLLIDSPVLGGWRARTLELIKRTQLVGSVSPGKISRQRRNHWPSEAAALEHFAKKKAFARWEPQVLRDYIHLGTHDATDGHKTGRVLSFDREVETAIYNTLPHNLDRLLRAHPLQCPVAFLGGKQSLEMKQVGMAMTLRLVGKEHPQRIQMLEGSHLFPMERPQETAAAIEQMLHDLGGGNSR